MFTLPSFFYEMHVILGGLRDKNFKFHCIYVPTRIGYSARNPTLARLGRFSIAIEYFYVAIELAKIRRNYVSIEQFYGQDRMVEAFLMKLFPP